MSDYRRYSDVMIDGGLRRGREIFIAPAFGAIGALLGRADAFAFAAHGGAGMAKMI